MEGDLGIVGAGLHADVAAAFELGSARRRAAAGSAPAPAGREPCRPSSRRSKRLGPKPKVTVSREGSSPTVSPVSSGGASSTPLASPIICPAVISAAARDHSCISSRSAVAARGRPGRRRRSGGGPGPACRSRPGAPRRREPSRCRSLACASSLPTRYPAAPPSPTPAAPTPAAASSRRRVSSVIARRGAVSGRALRRRALAALDPAAPARAKAVRPEHVERHRHRVEHVGERPRSPSGSAAGPASRSAASREIVPGCTSQVRSSAWP